MEELRRFENKNERNTMNNNTFEGKVALVTGGTSGIGKATAIAFARAGAKVVLSGRREKEGAQVVAEIKKLGGQAAFVRADVAKNADVKAMVDFTVDKFGRLDIAFNNAGVEWKGPLDQATEAEYRRIFDINVWGVLNSMRHEIPVMLKNGGGAIVNTSSVAGHVGLAQVSVYSASKHAVEGLTNSVALEFANQKIRINANGPGVFGPPRDPDAAVAVLREAVAAGVNHIDTSDFYGPHVTNQIIRRALHPYPKELVIVTKVGARRGADKSWIHDVSRQALIDS